jgi:hypothetical protein
MSIRYLSNGHLLMSLWAHGKIWRHCVNNFLLLLPGDKQVLSGGGGSVSTTEEAGAGDQLAARETGARQSRCPVGDTRPTRVKKPNLRYDDPEWVCDTACYKPLSIVEKGIE